MKKVYKAPILTELTKEQAKKLVASRKNCTEEEAAKILKRLRIQLPNDSKDQKRKRSA